MPESLIIETGGVTLAALAWGAPDAAPVLALHGWLDNAATFAGVAPRLPGRRIVALDLPGHGHSGHRTDRLAYHVVDYVGDVLAAADRLGWPRFDLVGHSLGAGIACLIAAAFPDRIRRLALIEGLGPASGNPDDSANRLARAVQHRARFGGKPVPVYATLDEAVAARHRVSDMQLASARTLVERNLAPAGDGVTWRTDQKLTLTSPLYMSEPQVLAFLGAIRAPTLLVRARQGFLINREVITARIAAVPDLTVEDLAGGHHLHLDDPAPIAAAIDTFLAVR